MDYAAGSIGIDFGTEVEGLARIELKTAGTADHRLNKKSLEIYSGDGDGTYEEISRDKWNYTQDHSGNIQILLDEKVTARQLKVHCNFDDWAPGLDEDGEVIRENRGEFTNILEEMITVYSRKDEGNIDYDYDEAGNRTRKTVNGDVTDYKYYADTNKLKTDGEYAYVYDEAGNLVKKGNSYNIEGDNVTFTETEGRKVEYYEYTYNLQGRLAEVTRNGEKVAEFIYDTDGMRIKSEEKLQKEESFQTTDYVYSQRGDVLLEDTGSSNGRTSYVYAFEKTFARVDGTVTPREEMEITYFHHDTTDSTRLMTDSDGEVTMDQDYLPFGGDLPRAGKDAVVNEDGESYKYTGQKEVVSIGLYYYKARWYDPSIGRFNREDDYQGELKNPQSLNLYVYVLNNPLVYGDPTGNINEYFEEQLERASENIRGTYKLSKELLSGMKDGNFTGFELQASMEWNRRSANFWSDVGAASEGADDFGQWINRNQEIVNLIPAFGLGVNIGQGIDKAAFGSDYYFEGDRGFMDWAADTATSGMSTYIGYQGASVLLMQYELMRMGDTSATSSTSLGNSGVKYTAVDSGPLKPKIAKTFRGASYTEKTLKHDTTLYRVYGGESGKVGSFMTRIPQRGGLQSQIDLALKPAWRNTAEKVTEVTVPKGTVIYEGSVAPQTLSGGIGEILGGGNQIYIPEVDASWFGK